MPSLADEARRWLEEDPDPTTRAELERILAENDEKALQEAFGARLEFGTAGLRGFLGPGPGRMNRALVRRVSCGLGRYLLEQVEDGADRGVVVGYDGRHMSPDFARDTAEVLAGLGIRVHLFDRMVPTPVVSVAVRSLGAAAGVMVTASHNPPEYNGYKVYWGNGAQIIPPHDEGISEAIEAIESLQEVPLADLDQAVEAGWVTMEGEKQLEDYLDDILRLRRRPDIPLEDLKVVYTPLHGVGGHLLREALVRAGLEHLHVVEEQFTPDGDFPTVRFPNPEEEGAMDLALAKAAEVGADLVLANDPDADRLAVALPEASSGEGGWRMLSGDQIGSLLGHYLLTENLPSRVKPLLMTTIVSSRLLSRMAAAGGAAYDETLTGFKWIANVSQRHRREDGVELILGYEEALGYSVGMVTADKDGISAALLFAELAAVERSRGRTVLDRLDEVYRSFGLHLTRQHSLTLPGAEGAKRIEAILAAVRRDPPRRIGETGPRVLAVTDYADGSSRALVDGAVAPPPPLDLPRSNVLALHLQDDARILLRPSGTEPKVKFYFEIVEPRLEEESLPQAEKRARERLDELEESLLALIEEL